MLNTVPAISAQVAVFLLMAPTETGSVWEPDLAASHAGAGAAPPPLRAASEGLPEETAPGCTGQEGC